MMENQKKARQMYRKPSSGNRFLRDGIVAGLLIAFMGLAVHAIAASDVKNDGAASAQDNDTLPVIEPWGYPLDAFDGEIRPQDDFYQFANGGWLRDNDIPGDRSGIGFSVVMRERNEERMTQIIDKLQSTRLKRGSDEQKIRDLYLGYMDAKRIEKLGTKPFAKDFERILSLQSHDDVARLMADPELGLNGPFSISINSDSKNPENYAVWASHSGLSMPDRSYYLRDDERLAATRQAYLNYIQFIIGVKDGALQNIKSQYARRSRKNRDFPATVDQTKVQFKQRAEAVFALEKSIAERHWSRAERRNASRTYNPYTLNELTAYAPEFPWQVFAQGFNIDGETTIIVREKEAFPSLAKVFRQTPVAVWRDYLLVHYINANGDYMPKLFDDLRFGFFGQTISGQKEQRGRDRRALGVVNLWLNQAIGKIYIEEYFPEKSKQQMTVIFENIRTAFKVRIENLTWMTPATKTQALDKLSKITAKIAYPEVWRDYSNVLIKRNDVFGNVKRLRKDDFNRNVARLGTKVDKREWFSGPQTVNAFYSPTRNEAFIPAGYIQSPLFDPNADPALNYGAIGSIIGHEIGHGFDDQGSKYDGRGVLQSWWTDEDRSAFDALGDRLAAQFDQYEPLPGIHVNGRQTLGENIGDLAGMTVAYHAYILSLNGAEAPVLDGLTGVQRFFLGRAQGRRFKRTEASLRRRLLSAPHSPMNLRVNGMIRNMDEFYEAFDLKEGDGLYLPSDERVRIW